ncbi:MAG: hypothetical protein RBT49_03620 [Bacteroidales bacterium]|jgi:hypothetical protein|nr:hypothetical protein [Bacteroidales bacterium]
MKIKLLLVGLISFFLLFSCENDDEENNIHDLPNGFPLKVGSAWKYQKTYFENGEIDTTYLDTLYISGTHESYYLYSWNPEIYKSLVKNVDNKLISYGHIGSSVTFYDEPLIFFFYGKVGCLNSTDFENYDYDNNTESFCISIQNDMEYLGDNWDTYVEKITYLDNSDDEYTYYNSLGTVKIENFNEYNIITYRCVLLEKLENVYPPQLSIKKTETKGIYYR